MELRAICIDHEARGTSAMMNDTNEGNQVSDKTFGECG
jgi:hypothetical protein